MDLRSWIGQQHGIAHRIIDDEVVARATEEQVRARPPGGGNALAWTLWHTARVEDVAVNAMIRGIPQVLLAEGWAARLSVPGTYMGTGMGDDEVTALVAAIDLDGLAAYRRAVRDATAAWIRVLDPAVLDGVPDVQARIDAAGALWPESGAWVREMWQPWPASVFLNWTAIGHTLAHAGEMNATLASLGTRGR